MMQGPAKMVDEDLEYTESEENEGYGLAVTTFEPR